MTAALPELLACGSGLFILVFSLGWALGTFPFFSLKIIQVDGPPCLSMGLFGSLLASFCFQWSFSALRLCDKTV